jgi:hypothetical protein
VSWNSDKSNIEDEQMDEHEEIRYFVNVKVEDENDRVDERLTYYMIGGNPASKH